MDDLQQQQEKTKAKTLGAQADFDAKALEMKRNLLGVDDTEDQTIRSHEAQARAKLVASYEKKLEALEEEKKKVEIHLKDSKSQLTEYQRWSTSLFKQLLEASGVDWDFLLSSIPIDLLKKLAKAEDWRVRQAVAKNRKTPVSILQKLLDDDEDDVATAAEKTLKKLGYNLT